MFASYIIIHQLPAPCIHSIWWLARLSRPYCPSQKDCRCHSRSPVLTSPQLCKQPPQHGQLIIVAQLSRTLKKPYLNLLQAKLPARPSSKCRFLQLPLARSTKAPICPGKALTVWTVISLTSFSHLAQIPISLSCQTCRSRKSRCVAVTPQINFQVLRTMK